MLNAFIVVWRESLEAMLVIGVLLAWIARQPHAAPLKRGIFLGVVAGLGLAVALGFATFLAQSQLAGQSLEIFQLCTVLFATALIVQMVLWMHRHGRQMKRALEVRAQGASGALGVGAISALAVAREGAETVVFVYGLGLQAGGAQLLGLLGAAMAGLAVAGATVWLVGRGARYLNYATLFRVSEMLLLLIAGALLVNAVDRMIALDWLPLLMDTVWDSSAFVNDASGVGRVFADFLGYRARPSGVLLLIVVCYWSVVVWQLQRRDRHAA